MGSSGGDQTTNDLKEDAGTDASRARECQESGFYRISLISAPSAKLRPKVVARCSLCMGSSGGDQTTNDLKEDAEIDASRARECQESGFYRISLISAPSAKLRPKVVARCSLCNGQFWRRPDHKRFKGGRRN